MASIVSAGTTSATALNMSADTSGVLQLASNNGTVALTIGTSQNIGFGTTSPNFECHISTGSTASITQPTAGSYGLYIQQNTSGSVGGIYIQDGASNNGNSLFIGDNNGAARLVVDADGNFLLGTATANGAKFAVGTVVGSVVGTQSGWFAGLKSGYAGLAGLPQGQLAVYDTGTAVGAGGAISFMTPQGSDATWGAAITASKVIAGTGDYGCDLLFFTRPSGSTADSRGRFTSEGYFLIGKNTYGATGGITFNPNVSGLGFGRMVLNSGYGAAANSILFEYNGTQVGLIQQTTTATSYVTSSDYRLKNNIAPMTGALAKVALLKPVTYKWNVDGSDGQGFIAHELQEVVPDAVSGSKDEVDEDGKPAYQGVDTSFLVATLTAAIQELSAKVTALESK
jgi:hypothetical protein